MTTPTKTHVKTYLSAELAHELLNAGAAYIGIYVNVTTDTETCASTYNIVVQPVDANKLVTGDDTDLCPTPCPVEQGHHDPNS